MATCSKLAVFYFYWVHIKIGSKACKKYKYEHNRAVLIEFKRVCNNLCLTLEPVGLENCTRLANDLESRAWKVNIESFNSETMLLSIGNVILIRISES